jgi:hypothetical protein
MRLSVHINSRDCRSQRERTGMSKKGVGVLFVAWIVLLTAAACAQEPKTYYDNGVSDEAYVSIARLYPDAQAFLELYPRAETYVDRSGSLAVDFRETRTPATDTNQEWKGIRLRVFIDPDTNRPIDALIQCDSGIIENNLLQHMEQYFPGQACP